MHKLMIVMVLVVAAWGCGSGSDNLTTDTSTPLELVEQDLVASDTEGQDGRGEPGDEVHYTVDGMFIRDSLGRALILRGVNFASSDRGYWEGQEPDEDLRRLRHIADSGFNAIRLPINWDRIEPQPDVYDQDYINLVARHVRLAQESGLYVIVDMHQDMFGMGFGLHGAPRWACDEALYASFEPTDPWFFNYFSEEVSGCFDRFWNDLELQDHQHRAAAAVAEAVAGYSMVLGFDTHNEPFPGTAEAETFGGDYMFRFHENFTRVVEQVLPGRLTFFEPAVTFSAILNTSMPGPITSFPGVFYPHYYNISVEMQLSWDGNADLDREAVQAASAVARRLNVPWGYGEMGGDVRTPNMKEYLENLYSLLDQDLAAVCFIWIYGQGTQGFALLTEEGDWNANYQAFLRITPTRVAGTPRSFGWDVESRTFHLEWDQDTGATELTVPKWVRDKGFTLTVDGKEIEPVLEGPVLRIPEGAAGPRKLKLVVAL